MTAFSSKILILPALSMLAGILLGLIFEKIILFKITKLAKKTKWKADEILFTALKGMVLLWFIFAGLYGAILTAPVKPVLADILTTTLLVCVIFSVTAVLARIAVRAIKLYSASTEGTLPSSTLFVHFTRTVIFLIGILVILNALNVSITPMLTALGVGGIAIALALQDTLSNFFAGVHVLASRQIKPKDYIKLDSGEEGYILDITWRNTIIKNLPNNIIIVPNSKLSTAIITNYNLLENFIKVYIGIGVSYDSDLEQVEKVTLEVANEIMREIPGGVPHYEPAIRYHTFADFSINLNVVLLAQEFASQYLIKHEFIKRLHKRYNQEGIVIPYPIRTIYSQGMIHESPQ